ncbi:MAG TPA: hypothetical protein VGF43_16685 [Dongiaceae bacterium]|jgi:hypothetical protein
MSSPVVHRKLARVYLARAEAAPTRDSKAKYLRFAVSSSVRAQTLEATTARGRRAARRKAAE